MSKKRKIRKPLKFPQLKNSLKHSQRNDPKHLDFIKTLPCCICFKEPVEPAHIRFKTDGGTALKPSDKWTVPLCHDHHAHQHQVGEPEFWYAEHRRDPHKLAERLYGVSGKYEEAINILEDEWWNKSWQEEDI